MPPPRARARNSAIRLSQIDERTLESRRRWWLGARQNDQRRSDQVLEGGPGEHSAGGAAGIAQHRIRHPDDHCANDAIMRSCIGEDKRHAEH